MKSPLVVNFKGLKNIGVNEINHFLLLYKSLLLEKADLPQRISFFFGDDLDSIDELFYSYVLLFSRDFPTIEIILSFKSYSKSYGIAEQQVAYLHLYRTNIKLYKGWSEKETILKKSKEYFPQLLIQDKRKEYTVDVPDFFEKREIRRQFTGLISNLSTTDSKNLKELFSNKYKFYDALFELIDDASFDGIFLQYVLASLHDLDVLRYCFKTQLNNTKDFTFKISNLSQESSIQLASETLSTLTMNGFFNFSYIEIFLFRILIANSDEVDISSRFAVKQEKQSYNLSVIKIQRYLRSLLIYVKDLSTGLVELAKNIKEHSCTDSGFGFGVISARILKDVKVNALKYSGESFEKWFGQFGDNRHYFLDINVIDSGRQTVTSKYIENVKNEIKELEGIKGSFAQIIRTDYEQDVKTMTDTLNPYCISDFLNYQQISLFHQVKRVNSRLGLLIFANLVLNQKHGFIKVSSNDLTKNENSECAFLHIVNEHNELFIEKFIGQSGNNAFSVVGTNYHFTIPVERKYQENEKTEKRIFVDTPTGTSSSIFKKLHHFKLNESDNYNDSEQINILSSFLHPSQTEKYKKIYEYRDNIFKKLENVNKKIALINANETKSFLENSSDWMRFLAAVQIVDAGLNLIVYNISEEIHNEIIEINRFFDRPNSGFWNARYAVLFYIKVHYHYENKQTVGLWFNDLLFGQSHLEYENYNREISRYHDNLYRIKKHEDISETDFQFREGSGIFFSEGKLLNFELILKNDDGLTLFEDSVRSLLELEVHEEQEESTNQDNYSRVTFFRNLKGYKISRSHFKLGSKIHISDFYYAKRLFYNSFYANRFAYLIADYIHQDLLLKNKYSNQIKITLIGYSNYSELLVSNIRRLLNDWGFLGIRHDVVLENEKILKSAVNIQDNILIIIPISSTFTTSQKIKRILFQILKGKMDTPFPDINAMVIGNQGFSKLKERFACEEINELYKSFGWQLADEFTSDQKIICVKHDDKIVRQKYFIGLETEWQPIYSCKHCFDKEVCLLETENNSVTPDLIFGLPITSTIKKERNLYELFKAKDEKYLVSHHHIKKGERHYYFYVRAGVFLTDPKRKDIVVQWLVEDIKKHPLFRRDFLEGNRVIIVTPSLTSNSGFVNLVNQVLFMDTATVLQFSTAEDCLQNFVKFNGPLLNNSKVIFVDDSMSTGNSFHMIENYIRNVYSELVKTVDFCITLFNQLGFFEEKNVARYLDKGLGIQFFAKLNIPSLMNDFSQFPYSVLSETYRKLAEKSTMEMMQIHFKEEQLKFEPLEIDHQSQEPKADLHSLLHFLVYHELFNLFNGEYRNNYEFRYNHEILDDLKGSLEKIKILENVITTIKKTASISSFLSNHSTYHFEVEMYVIRVFAEPPFVQYKRIKELVFEWVIIRLNELVKEILKFDTGELPNDFFDCLQINGVERRVREFSKYNTFKLLLRIAVKLKINILFSRKVLIAIKILLTKLKDEATYLRHYKGAPVQGTLFIDITQPILFGEPKRIFAVGLATYYVALVQELIIEDEAKATQLVKYIVGIIRKTKIVEKNKLLNLRNDFENPFIQLLRILVLENTFIFDTFFTNFFSDNPDIDDFTLDGAGVLNEQFITFNNEYLENYIKKYRFDALNLMLSRYTFIYSEEPDNEEDQKNIKVDEGLMEAFKKTMYLKNLLRRETFPQKKMQQQKTERTQVDLKAKIENILGLLCDILSIKNETERGGGAYFAIRYKEVHKPEDEIVADDLYTIVNYFTEPEHALNNDLTNPDSIAFKIFRGLKDKGGTRSKSTFELMYDTENVWKYRDIEADPDSILSSIELQGDQLYRNVFFLRVSDITAVENKPRNIEFISNPVAVLGFYRNIVIPGVTPKNLKRFDPKRIRFLLLLKEDINRFIKHHLSNDSFMAYVDQKEKENYMYSLKHGISTYKNAIREPLLNLQQDRPKANFRKNKDHLRIAIAFLVNKIQLMSLVSKCITENTEIVKEPHSLNAIFKEFSDNFIFILKFRHETYRGLREEERVIFTSTMVDFDPETEVFLPESFLHEMIFEIVFNIRKHIVHDHRIDINDKNPLQVRISIQSQEGKLFFVVENNFNYLITEAYPRLTKSFLNSKDNHGLNMITNILKKEYGPLIFTKSEDNFLMVKVPLTPILV